MSYDSLGQRIRVRNYGFLGNQTFSIDQLMLFNKVFNSSVSANAFQDVFKSTYVLSGLCYSDIFTHSV